MNGGEIARGILERQALRWPGRWINPGPADASIFDVQDGHCIAESFKNAGITWTPRQQESRLAEERLAADA
jgi:hypothetical protein